jgi:hypothetical protein
VDESAVMVGAVWWGRRREGARGVGGSIGCVEGCPASTLPFPSPF